MSFRVLFLAHAADADPAVHRTEIDTGMYRLWTVVVRSQSQALDVTRQFVQEMRIDSILLCPGFTHGQVAAIKQAAGPKVGVSVARGDGPAARLSLAARQREGYSRAPKAESDQQAT